MKKGIISVLISYLAWGVLTIFWKQFASIDSIYVLSSRILWSFISCLIYLIIVKKSDGLRELKKAICDKKTMLFMVGASLFISVNWGVYIWSVGHGHIIESSLGYFLNPIIIIVFGFIFFNEKLNIGEWVSVALATAGVLYAIIASKTLPFITLILAFSFSFYSVFKKKVNLSAEAGMVLETAVLAPVALAYIIFSECKTGGTASALTTFGSASYLMFILAGILTAIPLFLFSKAIKFIPMTLSGILIYINPTLQFLIGVLLYNEPFTQTDIITFIIVWVAVIIFVISSVKKQSKEKLL